MRLEESFNRDPKGSAWSQLMAQHTNSLHAIPFGSRLNDRPRMSRRRTGSLLHETTTALLIVMAVVGGAYEMLHIVAKQRRFADQRTMATLEAGNLMEELASRKWSDIAAGTPKLDLSQACRARLPEAELHLAVIAEENDSNARRITISIDWQSQDGRRCEPVQLVAWRYQPLESKP
jgi:hypothetical protein